MKIFAKRKRKSDVSSADNKKHETATIRTTFQSDAVVEELLKENPATWNAKQRRMIKRYQDRKKEFTTENTQDPNQKGQDEESPLKSIEAELPEKTQAVDDHSDESSSDDGSDYKDDESDNEVNDNFVAEECNNKNKEIDKDVQQLFDYEDDESDSSSSEGEENEVENDLENNEDKKSETEDENGINENEEKDNSVAEEGNNKNKKIDKDLQKLLDKLNSKQRRKITRAFERDGDLKALRLAVEQLIKGDTTDAADKESKGNNAPCNKRHADQMDNEKDEAIKSKKRRRGRKVDWSALPAEERLRREEQRRLQQEAAKVRAEVVDGPGNYKHPLNSERRRANRRKPKWASKKTPTNDHNSSGYLIRKVR